MPGQANRDSYQLFSVAGLDFIIVNLENSPYASARTWASGILAANASRRAIVVTHDYLSSSGTRSTAGTSVWNDVVLPNCNVFVVLAGHALGEARLASTNSCGGTVTQILQDYQGVSPGGDGWLRYYTFKPSENKIYAYTYQVPQGANPGSFETDANSQFTLDYAMGGSGAFSVIGADTGVASGGHATIDWPGRATGTEYEWYVDVNDGSLTTSGPTWSFTTEGTLNYPPVCSNVILTTERNTTGEADPSCTDADADPLTYGIVAQGAHGVASVVAGKLRFVPTTGYEGPDTFTYKANDGQVDSNTATVSVTVTAPGGDVVLVGAGDIADGGVGAGQTAALIAALPSATVVTFGDNAYPEGTASDFATKYDPTWGAFKARTHPSVGNHDWTNRNAGYFPYFGAASVGSPNGYYSYDVGPNWHAIVLNTEIGYAAGSAQELWLRADLAAHSDKNVVAYWHRPRFDSGNVHGTEVAAEAIWDALYEYGADLVLNGHEHWFERFAPQTPDGVADAAYGIRQLTCGTGGGSRYSTGTIDPNSEVRNGSTWGVCKLTLHETSYDWQFIPVAGGSFTDSGTTAVHAAPPVNHAPTIALSAPADGATGVALSPTLDAVPSDVDGDDLDVSFYGRVAGGGSGSVAIVQAIGAAANGNAGETSTVLSVSKTVSAGNTIIVGGCYYAAAGTESVVDNLGNVYTRIERSTGNGVASLWAAPIVTGGTLTSITFSHPATGYSSLVADEFSGVGTLASVGGGTTGYSTTGTWASSKTIPANGLAVGVVWNATTGNTVSAGAASGSPSTSLALGLERDRRPGDGPGLRHRRINRRHRLHGHRGSGDGSGVGRRRRHLRPRQPLAAHRHGHRRRLGRPRHGDLERPGRGHRVRVVRHGQRRRPRGGQPDPLLHHRRRDARPRLPAGHQQPGPARPDQPQRGHRRLLGPQLGEACPRLLHRSLQPRGGLQRARRPDRQRDRREHDDGHRHLHRPRLPAGHHQPRGGRADQRRRDPAQQLGPVDRPAHGGPPGLLRPGGGLHRRRPARTSPSTRGPSPPSRGRTSESGQDIAVNGGSLTAVTGTDG